MNWIPLLLADPSPCLRLLVLQELLHKPESDLEVKELTEIRDLDPLIADFIKLKHQQLRVGSNSRTHLKSSEPMQYQD